MERKKKSILKKVGIKSLIVLVILTASTYAAVSMYFTDHYYYNTMINGTDYSYKTPVEAEEDFYDSLKVFTLEIKGRDGVSETLSAADIDLRYVSNGSFQKILREQEGFFWITAFFMKYEYDLQKPVEYDEQALNDKIGNMAFYKEENVTKPHDAYVQYLEDEKRYVAKPGSAGTELDGDKTSEAIRSALQELRPVIDLEQEGCYLFQREETEMAKLPELAEEANIYVSAEIKYNWNGSEVIVNADQINQWIKIDNDKVTFDDDAVKEYIKEQSKLYDTFGKNRIFHTTDGRDVELKSGGYGWKTDRESEFVSLMEAIKKGEHIQKEPAYIYKANHQGLEDIGDSYVEIDLGKQHLYLYFEGNMVLESDFVSGNVSRGWTTPPGIFGLTYKTRNAVLKGTNYETPVSYWMPFNGNIGMHDAGWRSNFGEDIYINGGSHGCINLPPENAKTIYEYLYTGFPVICYY